MKFCSQCGKQNETQVRFCSFCGQPFAANAVNQQPAAPPANPAANVNQPQIAPDQPMAFPPSAPQRKSKFPIFLILGALGVFGLAVVSVVGYLLYSFRLNPVGSGGKPTANVNLSPSSNIAPANQSATAISATDLFRTYKANAAAANQKYKGKIVAVTGTIEAAGTDLTGKSFALFAVGDNLNSVRCTFPDSAKSAVGSLKPNQSATLTGTVEGSVAGDVMIANCSIGGSTPGGSTIVSNSSNSQTNTDLGTSSVSVKGIGLKRSAVNLVSPPYPAAAKSVNASGMVLVTVTIDEAGNVVSATASYGHPLLRVAAESAARASKFAPAEPDKPHPKTATEALQYYFKP